MTMKNYSYWGLKIDFFSDSIFQFVISTTPPHSFIFLMSSYIFIEWYDFQNTVAKLHVKWIFMLTTPCKLGCPVINIILLTQMLSDSAGTTFYESWFPEYQEHIAIFLIFKENLNMPKKTNGLSTGFHISESIYRIFTAHMVE